ncbi:TPA: dimethyl sulfoxide reductase anchor subunit family protein [Escherichia coli]|uniref:dimethyl sulfoxide reductase anchor subunit family protein n=1 Tax=Escherichia coli TaxID=562 RepID=UPI001F13E065|nr:DmsC/YnfH family molybdoenzyme membrane anchor subunit [Escherichia coli]MCH6356495.1 dimethyl sulfoxide reductase anchor subunit [Escherichia coli]
MHELPLVFFTVLMQAVAGSFILLWLIKLIPAAQLQTSGQQFSLAIFSLWPLLALAGLAALTHLGQPLRALNVLFGLKHLSPMSLEIVMVLIFSLLGLSTSFLLLKKVKGAPLLLCAVLAALAAIGVLFAIANVYFLPTVSLWSTPWTVINFVFSGILSGSLLSALLLYAFRNRNGSSTSFIYIMKPIWGAVLFLFILFSCGYLFTLNGEISAIPVWLKAIQVIRILLLASAFLCCLLMNLSTQITGKLAAVTTAVIIAELLGRVFFYELILLQQL